MLGRGLLQVATQMQDGPLLRDRDDEFRRAVLFGEGNLVHAGSRPQHATREGGIIGVGLEGLDWSALLENANAKNPWLAPTSIAVPPGWTISPSTSSSCSPQAASSAIRRP